MNTKEVGKKVWEEKQYLTRQKLSKNLAGDQARKYKKRAKNNERKYAVKVTRKKHK